MGVGSPCESTFVSSQESSLRRQPAVFVLSLDPEKLSSKPSVLAEALSASPLWKGMEAILVLRLKPRPILAILGSFDAAEAARIRALASQLPECLSRLRYVGYRQVEQDCERLAARLYDVLGAGGISESFFVAIPRGGLIVLGILAYALALRSEQLEGTPSPATPLVVVDDCSLTGLRFVRFVEERRDWQIVFAPLYSHPDLRREIVIREPNVIACMSGQDLRDHGPDRRTTAYDKWQRRWKERSDPRCYWIGQTDHLCFPWNEPTMAIWNPVTGREEAGWRIGAPERCYANRLGARQGSVQVQPPAKGPLAPRPSVVFGELGGAVLAADTESKAAVQLEGSAADMWRAIVSGGSVEDAAAHLMDMYAVDEETLRSDLRRFIIELSGRGLLESDGATAEET